MKPRGLYEALLTKALAKAIAQLPVGLEPATEPLRAADAADRIALHIALAVERTLDDLPDNDRVTFGTELVGRVLQALATQHENGRLHSDVLEGAGVVLRSVSTKLPDGRAESIPQPLIPLLDNCSLDERPRRAASWEPGACRSALR